MTAGDRSVEQRHAWCMPSSSRVSIYEIGPAGETGARLGSGSLIHPGLVLVHPPLSRQLAAAGTPVKLRLGVGSDGLAEVIDGGDVHVAEDQPGEPLVAIDVKPPAAGGVESLDLGDGQAAAVRQAATSHLDNLTDQPDALRRRPVLDPDLPGAPWCKLWPRAWMC